MFYILKEYGLSCNNSCVESSSPFKHAKKWFLKRRLDTNLYQVLIGVKYTRDWQLGLKKNLQDSVVKSIIFMTQKMKFSVKDLFNKYDEIRSFMQTCLNITKCLKVSLQYCYLLLGREKMYWFDSYF